MSQTRTVEIAADHAAYAGHFPEFPVLPGAVLLDEALRIIGGACGTELSGWQLSSAKFSGAVRPGDPLRIEFDADDRMIRFSIFTAQRKVVSGVLAAAEVAAS